jgi:hypothetical protein
MATYDYNTGQALAPGQAQSQFNTQTGQQIGGGSAASSGGSSGTVRYYNAQTNPELFPGSQTTNPTAAQTNTQPVAPGQPVDTSQPGTKPTSVTPATGNSTQSAPPVPGVIKTVADAKAAGAYDAQNGPGAYAQKYQTALANAQASGKTAPQSAGPGSAGAQGFTPPPAQPLYDSTKADAVLQDNQAHQQYIHDYTQSQTSQAQTESLTQTYSDLMGQLGIPALNTELMNMKNIMDGTEQDIRNEVTKAGGFATNSQVLAMTDARNKTMIQNYNNLLQTRDNAEKNLTTMMDLTEKDRQYAQQKINDQLNFDKQNIDYADKALNNAQGALKTMQSSEGWDGILKAALATGDPQAIDKINSTMGNGFDLATMAQQDAKTRANDASKTNLELQQLQATLANTKATTAKTQAETAGLGTGTTGSGTNGNIPSTLQPYLNTSTNGTNYIDASTLQGTASQKTNLINQATAAGLKVITNKNTAADLVNIQDANSKLDTVTSMLQGIDQPGWVERAMGGLGLTQLQVMAQSDPRKAAAGALSAIGTDVLKAMQGVQGSRMSQAAVANINKELPTIYDTQDTVTQKVTTLKNLLSDRENAALRTSTGSSGSSSNTTKSGKPFDMAGAKKAGYSDAQIQDYLSSH